MLQLPFRDRVEAGRLLGAQLVLYLTRSGAGREWPKDSIVLALPRGGVPVAFEVARALGLPLDVIVVRKLGVPWQPELAMGAIASGGIRVLDEELIRQERISQQDVDAVAAREQQEAERREQLYRAGRPALDLRNRTVILVDDGLATGSTMMAAVKCVKSLLPSAVIVAVPVASWQACVHLRQIADECVCLAVPDPFGSVGEWYQDFRQISDAEVRDLLSLHVRLVLMSDNHFDLGAMAHQEMLAEGFHPDSPPAVVQQVATLQARAAANGASPGVSGQVRDLRSLLWSSIDNDTSRDLDQAEVAERVNGGIRVMIAVADVDSDVPMGSPADQHASSETTSVYTGVRTFPMLPEALSTDLTSLNEGVDRLAIVIDLLVAADGGVTSQGIYRAVVRNQAQLAYNGVGAWLEGGAAPPKVAASADLAAQLKLQDEAAQTLLKERLKLGALTIDREETEAVVSDGQVQGIETRQKNRATDLIENFMVAANGVTARTLSAAGVSSIRRVVKTPERWPRIVQLAANCGETLPADPDSGALSAFLEKRKAVDPVHYADLSLAVVKLMGPGEYVLQRPGAAAQGHFALAARDYTHSTAPNRRFPDTVTQRLIKSVIAKTPPPYSDSQLEAIATNCTLKEDAARKVERVMNKRIAAVVLLPRIGETFSAVVTGVTPKGTFVRVLNPHAEGLLIRGQQGVDVGDQLQVKLVSADPRRGYIDFAR